jgi:hypothetical protein
MVGSRSVHHRGAVRKDDHPVGTGGPHDSEARVELAGAAEGRVRQPHAERHRGGFGRSPLRCLSRVIHVRQRGQRLETGDSPLEQLHPLAGHLEGHERDPGEVAPGARQAARDAQLDRVATDREKDPHVPGGPGCPDGRPARHDERDPGLDQLRDGGLERGNVPSDVAELEGDVLPFDVPEPTKPFSETVEERIGPWLRREPADSSRNARLLSARRAGQERTRR